MIAITKAKILHYERDYEFQDTSETKITPIPESSQEGTSNADPRAHSGWVGAGDGTQRHRRVVDSAYCKAGPCIDPIGVPLLPDEAPSFCSVGRLRSP